VFGSLETPKIFFLNLGSFWNAGDIEIGQEYPIDQPQLLLDIKATESCPFMSTITGMEPSPDWFSGFSAFDLREQVDGFPTTVCGIESLTLIHIHSQLAPCQDEPMLLPAQNEIPKFLFDALRRRCRHRLAHF
jgi:hypothetical protein